MSQPYVYGGALTGAIANSVGEPALCVRGLPERTKQTTVFRGASPVCTGNAEAPRQCIANPRSQPCVYGECRNFSWVRLYKSEPALCVRGMHFLTRLNAQPSSEIHSLVPPPTTQGGSNILSDGDPQACQKADYPGLDTFAPVYALSRLSRARFPRY